MSSSWITPARSTHQDSMPSKILTNNIPRRDQISPPPTPMRSRDALIARRVASNHLCNYQLTTRHLRRVSPACNSAEESRAAPERALIVARTRCAITRLRFGRAAHAPTRVLSHARRPSQVASRNAGLGSHSPDHRGKRGHFRETVEWAGIPREIGQKGPVRRVRRALGDEAQRRCASAACSTRVLRPGGHRYEAEVSSDRGHAGKRLTGRERIDYHCHTTDTRDSITTLCHIHSVHRMCFRDISPMTNPR